jgi:rod shape-determining protein MreC
MGMGASSVSIVRTPLQEAEKLLTYRKTYKEYEKLKRETNALKARVIGLEEMVREAGRLDRLRQFMNKQTFAMIPAVVIARDPANWNSSLMIRGGKNDGIRPGMAVVNADGVVGKVAEVADNVSKVVLVNDPGFSVAALNRRSRESGLVSGSLSGKCRMSYLPEGADVEAGDDIITSKLSTDFPDGLIVGKVIRVFAGDSGNGMVAEVEPAVEVSKIEEVLVIK